MNPEDPEDPTKHSDPERARAARTVLRILQAGGTEEQAREAVRSAIAQAKKTPTAPAKSTMPPLGEYGQGGHLYPRGTGNLPEGYAYQDLIGNLAQGEGMKAAADVGRMTANRLFEFGTAAAFPAMGKLGSGLASRIPKNAWGMLGRVLIPSAFETGTQVAGEAAREMATEGRVNPTTLKRTALWTAVPAVGLRGGAATGAYIGGVKPTAIQSALDDTSTMQRSPRGALLDARNDLRADAARQRLLTTHGRGQFEGMMQSRDAGGLKVDAGKMIEYVYDEADKLTGEGSEAAKRLLYGRTGNRILDRIIKVSPKDGMMSSTDFDKILREELTQSVYEQGRPASKMVKDALERARDRAAGHLYTKVSPGRAARMQEEASDALSARETIEDIVAKPRSGLDIKGIKELRNIARGEEGEQMRRDLANYDRIHGTVHERRFLHLAEKADWNPTDVADFQEIAQLPMIGYKPRALISSIFRELAGKRLMQTAQGKTSGFLRSLAVSEIMQPSHKPTGAKKEKPK